MRRALLQLIFAAGWTVSVVAVESPFHAQMRLDRSVSNAMLSVSFSVPQRHHLYADTIHVEGSGGAVVSLVSSPAPARLNDSFSGEVRESYTADFTRVYAVGGDWTQDAAVTIGYQGCSESSCFFPQSQVLKLDGAGAESGGGARNEAPQAATAAMLDRFSVVARAAGYMRKGEFLDFLGSADKSQAGGHAVRQPAGASVRTAFRLFAANPVEFFRQYGIYWTLALILIGGLLLNLTPCVLPMIPINLAIIGVGTQGAGRARGLLLGTIYGAGIACIYGLLGGVVVLTGATFGALNSHPVFNAAIAVLFVLLGLALFDVFAIDLTRFQGTMGEGIARRGKYVAAFGMGGISALLAGACVAPVVIAVLVLSGNLYSQGVNAGMMLPFVLGIGMALPWPLAGAGLSFLPKPGKWMSAVKYGFGVLILLLALYYANLAYRGWRGPSARVSAQAGVFQIGADGGAAAWASALETAEREHKPVFVDFWATWCKNCEAMEATTFRDSAVEERLKGFVVVKCQAENPRDPATQAMLSRFEVRGLPSYLVLRSTP